LSAIRASIEQLFNKLAIEKYKRKLNVFVQPSKLY